MRIITQEELDASPSVTAFQYWRNYRNCESCVTFHVERLGCTSACEMRSGAGWFWHGTGSPSPEHVMEMPLDRAEFHGTCASGHGWMQSTKASEYMRAFHNRSATLQAAIAADFDEEAERARLMPV